MTGILTGHIYKLGFVNPAYCSRCPECSETTLHTLCYCEADAGLVPSLRGSLTEPWW